MTEKPETPPEDTPEEPEDTPEDPEGTPEEPSRRRWLPALVIVAILACVYAIALFLTGRGDKAPPSASPLPVTVAHGFQPMSITFFDEMHGLISGSAPCAECSGQRGGIIASTSDAGRTWSVRYRGQRPILGLARVGRTNEVWATATVCDNASFVGCKLAQVRSTDLGQTWQPATPKDPYRASPPTDAQSCERDHPYPVSSSFVTKARGWMLCAETAVSSTYQFKGLFETWNGGRDWVKRAHFHPRLGGTTNFGNLPVDGFASGISFLKNGTGWLWAVGPHSSLSVSADSGKNWDPLWRPPDSSDRRMVAASITSTQIGYVLVSSPTTGFWLLVTHDGGKSWEPTQSWPVPPRG